MGRRRLCPNLTEISMEVLSKITDTFNHDIFFPGRDLNPRPAEQETGELHALSQRPVLC
jgi:hypothetical protein